MGFDPLFNVYLIGGFPMVEVPTKQPNNLFDDQSNPYMCSVDCSPLYVFSSTFTAPPTHADLLQVLSVVIWSITILVTFKYILVILHADNEGEGGTFSCYSLLTRFVSAMQFILLASCPSDTRHFPDLAYHV